MTRRATDLRGPLAMFRTSLITICALISVTSPDEPVALLMLFPLSVGALASYRSPAFAESWPYVAALLCAGTIPFTGGGHSALLPYLLASALTLGLTHGVRELVAVLGTVSAVLLAGPLVTDVGPINDYLVGTAQWVVLAVAVGLVPVWSRHLGLLPGQTDDYLEVRRLLEQVRSLARHLPGSLDAPAASEGLLERCRQLAAFERGAVIAQTSEGVFVPLAVLGVSRVPWRTPLAADGPLRRAWVSGAPARDSRGQDVVGRRAGSTVLALPLPSRHGPFALAVLETSEVDAFPQSIVDRLFALTTSASPQLETALMFEEVRAEASNEERDRLAREMHDGIAQELAVLGYHLDQVGMSAHRVDEDLAAEVLAVREQVTILMSELRLSITDLRTSVRPTRGLGAALSAYLPAVCSGGQISLKLGLTESPFRLPAEQEAALLKAAQLFAQAVRRTPGARSLTVELTVDPPSATLTMSTDFPVPDLRLGDFRVLAVSVGADVAVSVAESGEPSLTICLRGLQDDHAATGGRPRVDPAGAAPRLRAD